MHSYKQSKKQVATRWFFYGVLTVAVLVLSTIGILAVLGYQFDPVQGELEQTALIQFRSAPSGAAVRIDGKKLNGNTATRTNVTSGSHTAQISQAGYRDWSKTFNVTGGTVLWLNYALLVPANLKTTTPHTLDAVRSDATSPDKKWRLLSLTDKPSVLTLIGVNDPKNIAVNSYTVASDVLTAGANGSAGTLSVVSWGSGSRYALVNHTYPNDQGTQITEYLRFDRQNPGSVINVSRELGIENISKIGFSDSSGNTFYALTGGDIRKLDTGNGTISQPLVTNVSQMYYTDGGETIAYARTDDQGKTAVGVYRDAGGAVTTNTYETTPQNLLISYGEYYGYRYLSTYHDGHVYVIQSPDTRQPVLVKTIDVPAAQYLYFNPSGRMIVAQNGHGFMSYDLETDRVFNDTLGSDTQARFSWLDDFHLVSDAGDAIQMSDFDGGNKYDLGKASAGTGVELSNDAQWLYSVGTDSAGKTVLQQTALRI